MSEQGRCVGQNPKKNINRHDLWRDLNIGPGRGMKLNFVVADVTAWPLARSGAWKASQRIKTKPDKDKAPIRIWALDSKTVYTPVPYLTSEFKCLGLDSAGLNRAGVSFELARTLQGFMECGGRLEFATGVDWARLRQDQIETIPLLARLRDLTLREAA